MNVVGNIVGREVRDHHVLDIGERHAAQESENFAGVANGRVDAAGKSCHFGRRHGGFEGIAAEREAVDRETRLASQPCSVKGFFSVFGVRGVAAPVGERRNAVGQELQHASRARSSLALASGEPNQLNHREANRRRKVGRTV